MKKKNLKFLKTLLETPSPTGSEVPVANLVRERLADTADEIETNVMGSVHARLSGRGAGPTLMLAAHMDEIGLMVTYVSDEGFLSVSAVGGVDAAILPGMRVDVHAQEGTLRGVADLDREEVSERTGAVKQYWNVAAYDDAGDVVSDGVIMTKIVSLARLAQKEQERTS